MSAIPVILASDITNTRVGQKRKRTGKSVWHESKKRRTRKAAGSVGTHRLVCWNCHIAETFQWEHPNDASIHLAVHYRVETPHASPSGKS